MSASAVRGARVVDRTVTAPAQMRGFGGSRRGPPISTDIFEIYRLAVDAARRRRDPVGELPQLRDRLHQTLHVLFVRLRRQPLVLMRVPLGLAQQPTVR